MWWRTSNCSPLLIYRPREDERLSWPGWLTYSGRLTHISGHPSATGELIVCGVQPSRSRWQLVFFITASLHASGNLAYVLLGTSQQQQWTADAPSVNSDSDENAPLVINNVSNSQTYGTVSSVVS